MRFARAKHSFAAAGFALRFLVGFVLLISAFEASRGTSAERFLVEDCILRPAVALIRAAAAGDPVVLIGRTIASPVVKLHVTRGCEGVEIFLLLAAGILAFPAPWPARLRGLASGLVLAYILSVSRLTALYFALRDLPGAWETLHGLILPLGPIILVTLYFMHWSAGLAPTDAAPQLCDAR